ncbi:regulatory protein RecX [Herbiconiux sp. A18JL235]|uniref:Regulatory protein RecX n=1 Tax=Herbiconiux sp. A18JL235 TaxID=3152363 RepID=A0AB39BDK4_9MICO
MNDIVNLDSVRRRGRTRPSAPESGADGAGTREPVGLPSRSAHPARSSHPAGRDADHETASGAPVEFPAAVGSPAPIEFPAPVELSDEERLERVSDTVVRALGRRQLSSGEAHELLVAQGASGAEADGLVARYEELGYLDDAALAEALVARLSERSHKSRAVIARELHARKIPSELVTAALENLDDDHEFELAVEAAVKRVGQLSRYDDETAERRLNGFLARRGFGSSIVREATRRAMATRKAASRVRFR